MGSVANADALLLLSGDPAAEDEPVRKGTAFQVSRTRVRLCGGRLNTPLHRLGYWVTSSPPLSCFSRRRSYWCCARQVKVRAGPGCVALSSSYAFWNILAKVLQQIKDGSPPVPIEILIQAKAKEPPTDAVPKFIEAYSERTRVGTLVKETYHGKLISEWNQAINQLAQKPEQVDMGPALATVMAVKDEDELVRLPVDTV